MDYFVSEAAEQCLGVAIDHRLRALFKPISRNAHFDIENSNRLHLGELARLNTQRAIRRDEVNITCQLFNYGWSGGITIILLQPSNFHPYWKGVSSVIEGCTTYTFLNEAFNTVSCGTLQLGKASLSIIDSAPYIRPKDHVSVERKLQMRRCTSQIIREKKSDVILCMWKDQEGVPTRMANLQSVGVGKDLDSLTVRFKGELLKRVNSFHPSYTANYNPHMSCLRQLLLLNIAEACGIYEKGTWCEEEWMKALKRKCISEVSLLSKIDKSNNQYLVERLRFQLHRIEEFFTSQSLSKTRDKYYVLLRSGLSEMLNDASLCLNQLWIQDTCIHPDDVSDEDSERVSSAGRKCLRFLRKLVSRFRGHRPIMRGSRSGFYDKGNLNKCLAELDVGSSCISLIVNQLLQGLNSTFSIRSDDTCRIDLSQASEEFLSAAIKVERSLTTLLENRDCAQDREILEQGIGNLRI